MQYIAKEVNKPVYLDSHLEIDLGIDSLGRVELGLGLEALFKIKIPDELLYSISTIRDVIINLENLIESKMPIAEKAREEGWPEILSAAPPKQIMEKIKIGFGIYESSITWLFNKAFLFIFRLFWFLRIEGRENLPYSGPYLICPNHASYLDGLFIFSSLPFEISMNTYFLGYQHIFEHPLLGWSNRVARFISIDVSSHLTEAMQAVAYVLGCKKMICIFPEGMRSIDTEVKEFKKGVGILMKELAIPVVPVCIQGSHGSWPRGSRFPRPYPVKVIFGRPFNWEELKKEGARLGARDDYEAISLGLRQEVVRLKEKP
jgi:long-chain acyl-CoA synthetase